MNIKAFFSYSLIVFLSSMLLTFALSYSVDKRKHFWIRSVASFVTFYFLMFGFNHIRMPFGSLINTCVRFTAVILMASFFNCICYRVKFVSSRFLSIVAYTYRHMIYLVSRITVFILKDAIAGFNMNIYIKNFLFPLLLHLVFLPLLIQLMTTIRKYKDIVLTPTWVTLLVSGIAVLGDVIFNTFSLRYFNRDPLLKYWMNSFNILLCVMALVIMLGYTKQIKVQSDIAVMNRLEYDRNKRFRMAKENIEIINIKCHDLRHQIRGLEVISNPKMQEELKEIEKRLRLYDTGVKSGNNTLDILLSEKSLICHKNDISMDCIIDGKQIEFMSENEINALFGNIMDNAIESVLKIENHKKRIITLKINQAFGGRYIIEENPYEGVVQMVKGYPVTDKKKKYHGFGMKSIENVVNRYDGVIQIKAESGIFRLQIFFPKA